MIEGVFVGRSRLYRSVKSLTSGQLLLSAAKADFFVVWLPLPYTS